MPPIKITVSYKGTKTTYDLDQDTLVLGRPNQKRKVDVDLNPDMRTSRLHAELTYQDSVWWIHDLESHNGTERHRANMTIIRVSQHQSTEVLPGDELLLGDSMLQVMFKTDALDPAAVQPVLEVLDESSATQLDDFTLPNDVSEKDMLSMANLVDITNNEIGESMLDQCLLEIQNRFRDKAEYYCILLRKEKELLPFASLPRGRTRARFSYTLSRLAIQREQAFRWPDEQAFRTPNGETNVPVATLDGLVESMYAPILTSGEVSGVIHVGSDKPGTRFTAHDIKILSLMAKTIAPAVQRDWFIGQFKPDRYPLVFISYSHREKPFVINVASNLRRRFVRVWFDESLDGGQDWRENLAKAIRNADCFILICSPESVKSQYVKWEISTAQNFDKTIIPVMFRDTELPETIANLQYLRLDDKMSAEDQEGALRKLIEEIKKASLQ